MAGETSDELLALLDTAQLSARYWAIFLIMLAIIVLEFFDFGSATRTRRVCEDKSFIPSGVPRN
jgi:hypothetical protein